MYRQYFNYTLNNYLKNEKGNFRLSVINIYNLLCSYKLM